MDWRAIHAAKPEDRKRVGRKRRVLQPLTDDEIRNHLTGKRTIGIYPLLPDETYWFLAVDLTTHVWTRFFLRRRFRGKERCNTTWAVCIASPRTRARSRFPTPRLYRSRCCVVCIRRGRQGQPPSAMQLLQASTGEHLACTPHLVTNFAG